MPIESSPTLSLVLCTGPPRARAWCAAVGLALAVAACAAPEPEADRAASATSAAVAAVPPVQRPAPEGMVHVPGGTTRVGAADGLPLEQPTFAAAVAPFFLDRSPTTVARFRQFVDSTSYVTEAERFGDAAVMNPETGQWALVAGAHWRHPLGAGTEPVPDDHPVTQVSWNDAAAFCAWDGKRLPTEVEWEHAARGAVDARQPYAWGDRLAEADTSAGSDVRTVRYRANTWNGRFPGRNTGADGFRYTSPVGHYGATPLGLTDMGGNVWEWTDSWLRPYPLDAADGFTPDATSERVMRGGSFMCHASYCHGFRVSARSHATPESSLFHVGFRCARDAPVPSS